MRSKADSATLGTYCSSPDECLLGCIRCPNGTTTYDTGSDECYVNHFPGWSYAGCFNAAWDGWNVSSYTVSTIKECFTLARDLQNKFFAIEGDICLPLNGFSTSPGMSHSCSTECGMDLNGSKFDTFCGGPSACSLYAVMRATYLGVYESSSSLVDVDLLESVSSGFPSLQHCYEKAMYFGYKYFFLKGGVDCMATNSDGVVAAIQSGSSNVINVVKCGNGDPCGGPSTVALYSVDTPTTFPAYPTSSANESSSVTYSTAGCFADHDCRAILSTTFGIVGVIVLCCGAGLFIGFFDYYKSHAQLLQLADGEVPQNNHHAVAHLQHEVFELGSL